MLVKIAFVGAGSRETMLEFHAKLGNPGEIVDTGNDIPGFGFDPDWVEPVDGRPVRVEAVATADIPPGVTGVVFVPGTVQETKLPHVKVEAGFGNEWKAVRELITRIRSQLP